MRHQRAKRKFSRDANARKALFIGLAKNLIEREQIKTTLLKAKDLRSVVEKLITRAKTDSVSNRRLVASKLDNSSEDIVKKLFTVLGPRYADRDGGYTRVLKAGFRYGDAAPMAIIELIDRDENAKKQQSTPQADPAKKKVAASPKSLGEESANLRPVSKEQKPVKKAAAPKVAKKEFKKASKSK